MTIYYNTDDAPYNCFSNFSPHSFELDGLWWPTSEHYFQAQKFVGTHYLEVIRQAPTPLAAAQLGQDRARPLRQGWRQIKEEIMFNCVLHKFQIHADIRAILLSTGNRLIVEDWPHDYYWSCGADMSGKNRMGYILMRVRETLRMSHQAHHAPARVDPSRPQFAYHLANKAHQHRPLSVDTFSNQARGN